MLHGAGSCAEIYISADVKFIPLINGLKVGVCWSSLKRLP